MNDPTVNLFEQENLNKSTRNNSKDSCERNGVLNNKDSYIDAITRITDNS
jgi:hypothetical protein